MFLLLPPNHNADIRSRRIIDKAVINNRGNLSEQVAVEIRTHENSAVTQMIISTLNQSSARPPSQVP